MRRFGVVFLALAAAACAHTKRAPTADTATPAEPAAAVAETPVAAKACRSDGECGPRQLCVDQRCVEIRSGMAECGAVRVHFEFDRATLRADEAPVLERAARCAEVEERGRVAIEGNADERGTAQYNLALGQRRADAVARYLEQLGVPAARLSTVSFGKEQPLCTEHDEACWAKNRRASVGPGAGAPAAK